MNSWPVIAANGHRRTGERAHGRRPALRRGGYAPAVRARRTGWRASDPADLAAVARGTARSARLCARDRADRRSAGRGFSYALLRSVAGLDEGALQSSLDRLAEADLLFVEGAPPQANYRFKHALIQDAAYESLLRSRRQELHRRAAEILRNQPLPLIADLRIDGLALRVFNDELGDLPEGWDRLGGLLGGSLCLDRVNPAGDELPRGHRPVASIPEADRWISAQTFVLPDAIDLMPQYQFLTSSL